MTSRGGISTTRISPALLGLVLALAAGCLHSLVPFYAPRTPAWGYTSDDGRIYINESRPMCQVRAIGACRELALGRGGEFYWLVSLADDPVWLGAIERETCESMRGYVWERFRQRSSECTQVQLLLE
jgi:hypothetical protein